MTNRDWELFFKKLISNKNFHAQWLNTLSYLEYRGARKILRSLKTENITESILKHISEEARHALFFKKQAIRLGGERFNVYLNSNCLGGELFKNYFYQLDFLVKEYVNTFFIEHKVTSNPVLFFYPLVTWLIEERALFVYQTYQKVLEENQHSLSLDPLLLEEENHLIKVKKEIDSLLRSLNLEGRESFQSFLKLRDLEEKIFLHTSAKFMEELNRTSFWS